MSGKAQSKARSKGTTKRSNRRKSTALVRVPRGKIGFPQSMRTTLRLTHTAVFQPSGTTVVAESIQANGLFQPVVGVPKKPRGFDQFMALYGSYTVLGTKCHVRYMYAGYDGPATTEVTSDELIKTSLLGDIDDSKASLPVACGIRKGTEVLGVVSTEDIFERERTKGLYITPQEGSRTVTMTASTGEFFKNYTTVSTEGYSGSATANPAIPVYIEPWASRPVNVDDAVTQVIAFIELEFDTVFSNPQPLLQITPSGGM